MERSLDLEVTRRCNLRCDYCFVGWSRDWISDLPVEIATEIIREGAPYFDVLHLTGGEPFLYKNLYELCSLGLSLGYKSVLINSNGTVQKPTDIERLAHFNGRVALSISLDGPAMLHDTIRGRGMYERAIQTAEALVAAGVPVTIMSVVTPTWLHELPDFLRQLSRQLPGIIGVTLFPVGVGPSGSQKPGSSLQPLSPDELGAMALYVALAWHSGINVGVAAYPVINPLLKAFRYPVERLYQCAAGRGRVCIHADQSVSSCHPVKEPLYGRWSSGLFSRIPSLESHRRLQERDFDGCRTCSHQEECGHCRAFVTAAGAPLFGNDEICHHVVPGRLEVR